MQACLLQQCYHGSRLINSGGVRSAVKRELHFWPACLNNASTRQQCMSLWVALWLPCEPGLANQPLDGQFGYCLLQNRSQRCFFDGCYKVVMRPLPSAEEVLPWKLIGRATACVPVAASCTAAGAHRTACAPQATKRVVPYLFVRGDGVILVSPPLRS